MDTDFVTTQALYAQFLQDTPQLITSSLRGITPQIQASLVKEINSAKRIFFTAAGSSIPAAQYGVYKLQQDGYNAAFLPTGSVLGLKSLSKADLLIVCSQGMNRGDAALVIAAATKAKARHIVFTANRSTELINNASLTIYFDPEKEKLFCRPTGVATNLAVMAAALDPAINTNSLVEAWKLGSAQSIIVKKQMRYIALASDMMLPANWNMALALREGCGILAQNFDIETYAHGNYVGDLAHEPYQYITLRPGKETEAARSVRRFIPFITGAGVENTVIDIPFDDAARANLYVLGVIATSTYDANEENDYNMNKPKGKEENRYYHELDSYQL